MVSKWLCCTSRTEDDKIQPGVEKPSRGRGYSSFSITQDLAASDATAYGVLPISPLGPTTEISASSNASMHAQLAPQMPNNPYRRSDTAWAPYISTGALFPPTSQSGQHHAALLTPTSQPQQLYSRESTSSALHTGETTSKQLHSRRSTSKQSKRSPDVSATTRALRSGDSRMHPELNADVLSKHSALYSGHSMYSAALQPGQGYVDPILDSHQRVAAMLRTGDSTVHPILKSVPLQQSNMSYGQQGPGERQQGPGERQHTTGDRQLNRQPQSASALYTGDSSMQPGSTSEQQTHHPPVGTHQGSQSPLYTSHDKAHQETSYSKAPNHIKDDRAHAMLSSSTPDRLEEPTLGRQSSASSGSNDGAEQRSARGPAPTGPPSTVSRSGRIVHRAAKGIYLTLERQPDGRNRLLRIRFNRNLYSKKDAEAWWSKSKQALAQTHNLTSGVMSAGEQPGRVFVGEAPAPRHRRQDSINVDQRIASYIFDVTDGRNNAPVAVIQQADLLRKGLKYVQAAIYCQYNCQQLVLCACHALHAVSTAACQSNAPDRLSDQLTELLSEVAETTAVFSEPGWLLRLEGHIEDLAQITQLYAALTSLAATAGAAGPSNSNVVESAGFNTASPAGADQFDREEQSGAFTAGPAGGPIQIQVLAKPDWSDDSDALRGRLLELGGVAGLQTDTDCLLLKDLCRSGLEDTTFLDLIDLELQEHHASEVRGAHEVIRHTSMRLFWGRAAGPHEELPWGKFWDLFPSTLHGADTTTLMRQALAVIDNRRLFQAALSGMSCDYVTAGDVDKAFPPGQSIPDSFQRLMQVAQLQKVRISSRVAQQQLLESGVDILDTMTDADTLSDRQAASVDAQLYAAGFWRHEQDALLASYHDSISGLALKLSSANSGVYTTQQVSLRADGSEGCSGVALLGSHGSDAGLLAFGLARQMLLTGRWTQVGYAEMGGVGNEEEAAARMSAALGLPSYPLPLNETLRLCTWVKSRPASSGYLGLVVDANNGFKWPEDVTFMTAMLSTILGDTANIQIVMLLPEACTLPSSPWTVNTPPRMTRDVGVAVLQSNLGHSQIRFSQLGQLVEGCQQQPCLVRIAGRALAEGCVAPQAIVSQASRPLRQSSDAGMFPGRLSHPAADEAGQLPQWLLQMLSQDERTGLLRLSIFPLAFNLDMATSVLPSMWEQTQIQSLIQKLHRLGFVNHSPAQKTYQTEPYLRPHLAALAQQQPDSLYSPSLLGWSQACLQTCILATALFQSHAQVSALRVIDRDRGQIDGLLNALAHDLPAKALPVVIEIISKHMEPLSHRLSLGQKQQLCNNVGQAAEETGDLLGEVECAVQLAEQGCMDEAHAVQGLAGSMHLVERALGPDHPLLAHILLHRARLLRQRQQYHQANEALQSCLSIQETALGLDQPEVADTLQEMALTLQAQGLQDGAEPVLRQCLAIRSHALGMHHPDTAAVLHALACCLLSVDRCTDAEMMFGQTWRTTKQCLGHVHPKLAQVLVDLAALKARQNRPTEAQHLLRRSIAMWRQMGAGCHPALLSALETLAKLCRVHGSQEEEHRLRQECSCIRSLLVTVSGSEEHHMVCAQLSSVQVIASLPRGPARRLYTAPHSLLDTFPSQHPTRSPSHPPKQLLQKQPTSSSAFPTAVPPLMHSYRLPEQIPYQTAESASADVQELTSRSLIPILPAETAAASEPAAAADSAPSRSDQSWHGMRNSHHGPGSVSASSQGADDKSLRSTTGESVSNAVMGPASAAAAGSGLAYANSSLPAFRLPPAVGSPYEAFGANPVWVQNVHSQAASWHDSSSLTATPNAVVQDHRQQHQHKGVSPDHPNQDHLDLQSSNLDPRQHMEDHDQWTHHADGQAQLIHPASAQNEIQAQTQVQSQDQAQHLSQVQPEYDSAWSPQPLLSVGTTATPAASHGHESLSGYTNASPANVNLTAARSSDSLSGSGSANQVSNPHALSSSPLLSTNDQGHTGIRAGQPPPSPLGPVTSPEAQVGSAEFCSVSPVLSAQPPSSPGVQEAAEEDSTRQLSVRERALRSLSSKGIQLGHSASGKASRFGHARLESGSETAVESVQGSQQQLQDGDSVNTTGSNLDKDTDDTDHKAKDSQGLSQRAKAVKALSLRLDMGTKT